MKGVVELEDFEEDLKKINNSLEMLNTKKQENNNLEIHSFTPEKVMAQRDIEKVLYDDITKDNEFKDFEWNIKTKEQKQEFISKYIDNIVLDKKVNEYENTINNLEEENYSLRIKVSHLKKKFKKMLKFLHDKLFGWGKKEPIYNQVVMIF